MTTVQLFYDSNSRYRVSAVSYVDNCYSIMIIIHVHTLEIQSLHIPLNCLVFDRV